MSRVPITINISHVRKAKMCASGARGFFKNYDLDWNEFLKNGIDSNILENTGDAMALQVVEVAYGRG